MKMRITELNRFRGCLVGLAVGDAVGTTVEFSPRGSFEPVTDMVGGGPFDLEVGQWTDDTSMALCSAYSLVTCGGFDAEDQMKNFTMWYRNGLFSSTGICFDIGNTTKSAIWQWEMDGDPYAGSTMPWTAGNGCIMKLAPVPMFYEQNHEDAIYYSGESSRLTHAAPECVEASMLFGSMISHALCGSDKGEILFSYYAPDLIQSKIIDIANGTYRDKEIDEIKGSGYVVESLEAALWCFYNTTSYSDAVLTAVNLGDDTDTTAAIVGQLAGAYYGLDGISSEWTDKVHKYDMLIEFADELFKGSRTL